MIFDFLNVTTCCAMIVASMNIANIFSLFHLYHECTMVGKSYFNYVNSYILLNILKLRFSLILTINVQNVSLKQAANY